MYYKVLLLDAVADYDLPYIYKSKEPLQRGQLVLVPFGSGNKPREALVIGDAKEYAEAKEVLENVSFPLKKEQMEAIDYLSHYYATPPAAYARLFLSKALRVEPVLHWVKRSDLSPSETKEYYASLHKGLDYLRQRELVVEELSYRKRVNLPQKEYLISLFPLDGLEEYVEKTPASHTGKRRVLQALLDTYPSPSERGDLPLASIKRLEEEGVLLREFVPVSLKNHYHELEASYKALPALSELQQKALEELLETSSKLSLLQGVSASGKSYVYLHLAKACLVKGKRFLLLLPEGSLVPAMVELFKEHFGELVGVYHAQMSAREEMSELLDYLEGKYPIMITTRKGLFLPLEDVEIMVLDECQDDGYLSKHPYFHGLELAFFYGRQGKTHVVLGSATPPLALLQQEDLHLVRLDEPYHERQVEIELVDMRRELSEGNRSPLSRSLMQAIHSTMKKEGLTFLLMNKRLYASYIFCRSCGEALLCPQCLTSLSYDQRKKRVLCATCSYEAEMPKTCPHCGSSAFRYYGGGLQQVVEQLRKTYPHAKILGLDAATMRTKLGYIELHRRLQKAEVDVLVGTPLIARGLDFDVDLLGVINADFYLHLPNYRSGEKTFELLHQFLGRGGRRKATRAIIQSYDPDNYVLDHVLRHDVDGFMEREAQLRRSRDLPPFSHYILLRVQGDTDRVEEEALEMAKFLQEYTTAQVSEPYGHWTPKERKILLRSKESVDEIKELLLAIRQHKPWKFTVEVDPLSTI